MAIRRPALRAGKARMRRSHQGEPVRHIRRERRGFLRRHIDMQRHDFAGRRQKALGCVVQMLEVMQPLGVESEQLQSHAHAVARMQFAQIAGMRLRREKVCPRACIRQRRRRSARNLVCPRVEQHVVKAMLRGRYNDPVILDRLIEERKGEEEGVQIAIASHCRAEHRILLDFATKRGNLGKSKICETPGVSLASPKPRPRRDGKHEARPDIAEAFGIAGHLARSRDSTANIPGFRTSRGSGGLPTE